ncbi:very short patch repair endonuclease [uncultured Sphingosinicella sp.]|uniref:very short patch repair endonuclease n=1 Tax=uncultured Sphingosinicella sp. TaxID=478748 RepID=UPI0030D7AE88|tara:strand:+ start:59814 stop:60263 length:450 start_codon:yes stop_codon:yes gene_type:complete
MADVVDAATRSRMMAGIGGKNTRPEVQLRKAMHALGFRYRLHDRKLPGKPDLVFPRYRAAVFVHGCFWHRHEGCRYATMPATRPEFWAAKFEANVARDRRAELALSEMGWRTATVWECALRRSLAKVAAQMSEWLTSETPLKIEISDEH